MENRQNYLSSLDISLFNVSIKHHNALTTFNTLLSSHATNKSKITKAILEIARYPEYKDFAAQLEIFMECFDFKKMTALALSVLNERENINADQLETTTSQILNVRELLIVTQNCFLNLSKSLGKKNLPERQLHYSAMVEAVNKLALAEDELNNSTIISKFRESNYVETNTPEARRVLSDKLTDRTLLIIAESSLNLYLHSLHGLRSKTDLFLLFSKIITELDNHTDKEFIFRDWLATYAIDLINCYSNECQTLTNKLTRAPFIRACNAAHTVSYQALSDLKNEILPFIKKAALISMPVYLSMIPNLPQSLNKNLYRLTFESLERFNLALSDSFSNPQEIEKFISTHNRILNDGETCRLLDLLTNNLNLAQSYIQYMNSGVKKHQLVKIVKIVLEQDSTSLFEDLSKIGDVAWKFIAIDFILDNWGRISIDTERKRAIDIIARHPRGITLIKDYLEYKTAYDSDRAKITLAFANHNTYSELPMLRSKLKDFQESEVSPLWTRIEQDPSTGMKLLLSNSQIKIENRATKDVTKLEGVLGDSLSSTLKDLKKKTSTLLKWGVIQNHIEQYIHNKSFDSGIRFLLSEIQSKFNSTAFQSIVSDTKALNDLIYLCMIEDLRTELHRQLHVLSQTINCNKREQGQKVSDFKQWLSVKISDLNREPA